MGMSQRTFGVEIECFGNVRSRDIFRALKKAKIPVYDENSYSSYQRERDWVIKDDCSINPTRGHRYSHELASGILKGKQGIKQLRKVCRILTKLGLKTNSSCGIHVHLGAQDLKASEVYTVIKRYAEHEDEIDAFIGKSRRKSAASYTQSARGAKWSILQQYTRWKRAQKNGNPRREPAAYCSCGCGERSRDASWRTENPFQSVRKLCEYGDYNDRYCKVNTQAYDSHGTLEFRHYHGTVDPTEIVSWVRFLLNFVKQSRALTTVRDGEGRTLSVAKKKKDKGIYMGLRTKIRRHFKDQSGAEFLEAA